MLCGIALLGVVTATPASWMLARIRDIEQDSAVAPVRTLKVSPTRCALRRQLEAAKVSLTR